MCIFNIANKPVSQSCIERTSRCFGGPHVPVPSADKEKTSKVIGVMCKSRQYLPSNTLKTLYNSLFLPYINYCNIIWASTYDSHLEPLFLLQKKTIRIITFSPPQTHTKPLFHKLNILPIHSIFKCQVACFCFFTHE